MILNHNKPRFLCFKRKIQLFMSSFLVVFLVSCGGGGATDGGGSKIGILSTPFQGINVPVSNINYSVTSSGASGVTNNNGEFEYQQGQQVSFSISGRNYSVTGRDSVTTNDLANGDTSVASHLAQLLVSFDSDQNAANGIQLSTVPAGIDPTASDAEFTKQLYKALGRMPTPLFKPSLGINTEAPQGEADTVGQSMPFVDIFRTARPFKELSGNVTVDENGWPSELDSTLNFARTKALQGTLKDAIPSGRYTLLYEGTGTVQLSGPVSNVTSLNSDQGLAFDLNLIESDNPEDNALNVVVRDITPGVGNYIKNIRIIMPGGTCKAGATYNNALRVDSQADCPSGTTYVSFVDRLKNNRNEIIFNPDYLALLNNFKVVRMMNLMEASPGRVFCTVANNAIDADCVKEPTLWQDRATMDDAVWGGSSRTSHREHNGVPVEVAVELANQAGADPWFNMPHSADDNYVSKFAETVFNNLDLNRKAYIEYSNETWNSGFLGYHYVELKGIEAGFNTVPSGINRDEDYFARLRFYSKRAVEIFNIWVTQFSSNSRLVRVLGTNQGDSILSEQMLTYDNAPGNVDALATAPYFFGCFYRTGSCTNAPKVLSEATSVDDIFDIIDQAASSDTREPDQLALEGTIKKIGIQAAVANNHGVDLLAYEGGQHLTIPTTDQQALRDLFVAANRDARMKERYTRLLNAWKAEEGRRAALFTLYTLPQTYYQFGNWGIKEHLNKPRSESPKYDAAMHFQEQVGDCWWSGC